jgi:putative selenate reductase
MAELVPIPLSTLLRRMYHEYAKSGAIYDLPKRKFYFPEPDLDLSVVSCGNRAANPLGPAAGPHTQLAQNIVLSWLAGSRIIELKTVQLNDRLELSRPCIDVTTIGYNTEWSQELRLEDSAREYVKASMIVEILKHWLFEREGNGANLDTIFDVSVGYDLAGIQSSEIRRWLGTMLDASEVIESLRDEIPEEFRQYRTLPFKTKISDSITLSTFHGTPAGEIERICEFLMTEMGFNVVVKMNPPMLGRERLEQLLHETLGYREIEVNPHAYEVNIRFDDAAAMMVRLKKTAEETGRHVGVKFGNTLEVINKGSFLKDSVQYLSGQPLHVIHLALVHEWRKRFGTDFAISFSAGVDANNFSDCVSAGLVPVTTCTDLLRPGGYGRLRQYLVNLEQKMKQLGVRTIDEFIIQASGAAAEADAVMKNTADAAARSAADPRYRSSNTNKPPRKIGSHLTLWDCISCDKCIPVCPNNANFVFTVDPVEVPYRNIEITDSGWKETGEDVFTIRRSHQIGTYADACNECGNCDVFCPEDGGPYVEKPRFFGTMESFRAQAKMDGFLFLPGAKGTALVGRFSGGEYELIVDPLHTHVQFRSPQARLTIDAKTNAVLDAVNMSPAPRAYVDMKLYFVMAALLKAMLNAGTVNYVNINNL